MAEGPPAHVVDTNVLLVASAADPDSSFEDTHVPEELALEVLDWLVDLHRARDRRLVFDYAYRIYEEYRNKLSEQDYAFLVVRDKLQNACWVDVRYDRDGWAEVPDALHALDPSDRKLAAAVLAARAEGVEATVVNAADTDWYEAEEALVACGVVVEQLLPEWCRAEYDRKRARKDR